MTKVVWMSKNEQWVRMNSKNEKRFSRRLNIQVCELLQVLTEADIKKDFKKKSALGILKHNKQELKI